MIDPQVAWDKIAQFETSQELREFFQSEGTKGMIGHASHCPIASWLKNATGMQSVTVAGQVKMWPDLNAPSNLVFQHTKASEKFVKNFDHGIYLELVTPEAR